MRRAVILLFAALFALAVSSTAFGAGITQSVKFDPSRGELPEGLAIDKQGNAYVGMAPRSEVWKITPDGKTSLFAQLPSPGSGFLTGMEFGPDGGLYVALASFDENAGLYWVSPEGGIVSKLVTLSSTGLPNDVTFDKSGAPYVTDTIAGEIVKVDISGSGSASVWAASPLLAGTAPSPFGFPAGINGLDLSPDGSAFYAVVTESGRVVRIPINADGSAGAIEVIVEDARLSGADGIDFGADGKLYVAVNGSDSIAAVSPDGAIQVVAAGPPLRFPASLAFAEDGVSMFITNFDALRAFGVIPGAPQTGLLTASLNTIGTAPAPPATGNAGLIDSTNRSGLATAVFAAILVAIVFARTSVGRRFAKR